MTVKEQIPLLRQSQVPTPDQIRERLYKLFPHTSYLLKSILNPCAEEMEKMFCEATEEKKEKVFSMIVVSPLRNYYYCSKCTYGGIHKKHNYCPKCGTKIKWI